MTLFLWVVIIVDAFLFMQLLMQPPTKTTKEVVLDVLGFVALVFTIVVAIAHLG